MMQKEPSPDYDDDDDEDDHDMQTVRAFQETSL